MALQEENDRLTSQLDGLLGGVLPGTEQLEQGNDTVDLTIRYIDEMGRSVKFCTQSLSWDEIIKLAGPSIVLGYSQQIIEKEIAQHIAEIGQRTGSIGKISILDPPHLVAESQVTVITQLIALGLIEASFRQEEYGRQHIWKLTAYGERYVMKFSARRRPDYED